MSDSLPPIVQPPLKTADKNSVAKSSEGEATHSSRESSDGISSSRPLVFAILFGVTGALGLPLLWYSPSFSRSEKWLWSTVNVLYTLGLLAIAIAALKVIFDAFEQIR